MITFTDIPYASSQLRGEWQPNLGYLQIFTQDGSTLTTDDWNLIFKEITHHPKAKRYKPERSVVFSLGDLAFDTGSGFRFYEFYRALTEPYGYDDTVQMMAKLPDSKCGLNPRSPQSPRPKNKISSNKKCISSQFIIVGKAAGLARGAIYMAAGCGIASLRGGKNSGKVARLTWPSAYRTISKFRLVWSKLKK